MDRVERFQTLLEQWQERGLGRREFLRLVAIGTSAVTLSTIIAACGGDDDDDSGGESSSGADATSVEEPTATEASETSGATATPLAETIGVVEGEPQPTSAPFVDKELVIALNVEPDNLDVQNTTSNASAGVDKLMYEGLVYLDEKMHVVNLLAESWEPSDDAKEFVFNLRQGVTFHDGTPFNADAVKASFDRALNNDNLKRHGYFSAVIDQIEVVDEFTVKLIAKNPFAAMIATIAHPSGGILSAAAAEESGDDYGSNPVGTGPYKFVEWVRGDHITVEANQDYWDEATGPSVSRITVRGIAEPGALAIAAQSGDAQFAGPVNATQAPQLEASDGISLQSTEGMTIYWVSLNNQIEPFNNKDVRKALNYAINREQVMEVASLGRGYVNDSVLARGVWGYTPIGEIPYDPEQAKQLLSDAGYPDGFKSEIWTSAGSKDRAVAVQAQLSEIGVDVEVIQMESAALTEAISKPLEETELQMYMAGWSPSTGDADWAIRPLYTKSEWPPVGSNRSFYENDDLEEYVQEGLELIDDDERKEAYRKAQELIWDELPNIFLYAPLYLGAISDDIGGVFVQPDGVVYMRTGYFKG